MKIKIKNLSIYLLIITIAIVISYFILAIDHSDLDSSTRRWMMDNLVWGGILNQIAFVVSAIILLIAIIALFKVRKRQTILTWVVILNIIFILSLYNLHFVFPCKKVTDKITITTDKIEYRQGETAKITVKNNLDESIWYFNAELCGWSPWLSFWRFEGGIWEKLEIHKPGDGEECNVCVREYVPPEELIYELKSNSEISDRWILKNCEKISSVGPEFKLESIKLGIYRFSLSYGLTKATYTEKITYSNEFTIK